MSRRCSRHRFLPLALVFVCMGMVWSSLLPGEASARPGSNVDYYVDSQIGVDQESGGGRFDPWRTITYALARVGRSQGSGSYATLHVAPGLYDAALGEVFPLLVLPGISIRGAGADQTTLDAAGASTALSFDSLIYDDSTVVSGLDIRSSATGIDFSLGLPEVSGPRLEDLVVEECDIAVEIGASDGINVLELTRCRLSGNRIGIQVSAAFHGVALPLISSVIAEGNSEGGLVLSAYGAGVAPVVYNGTFAFNGVFGIKNSGGGANPVICDTILYLNGVDLQDVTVNQIMFSDISDGTHAGLNGNISADPRFVDAAGRDFRLTGASPCIDAGTDLPDVALEPTGAYGTPRLLDGNLDGASMPDMGAHEYDNVDLTLGGSNKFGATFTITTEGLAGLDVLLIAGTRTGAAYLDPYGHMLVMPGAGPWLVLPWGKIPATVGVDIPDDPSLAGFTVYFQAWAGDAVQGAGNFSNRDELTIE